MNFLKSVAAWFVGTTAGILLGVFILSIVLGGVMSGLGDKEGKPVGDGSVLRLNFNKPIAERSISDPFAKITGGNASSIGLNELLFALEQAKTDEKIKGVYLNFSLVQGGMASIEAIRNALVDFKTSKKFIYAYAEVMTEKGYYLASVADSVFLYPTGFMEWNGLNSNPMFYKGLLEKLEIEPKVFRVGTFKSAVEPFIQKEMSPANREQITTILNDMWNHMIGKIAVSRRLNKDELDSLASKFQIEMASDAKKYRLVDDLQYEDQVLDLMKKRTKLDAKEKVKFVNLDDYYANVKENRKESDAKVAVVYAVGDINSGKGDDNSIGSETTVAELRKARLDENVKAVVLRVNSPGGSALASDVIAREIMLTKKVKPVIASYGDVAASGGYYISAPCDAIVAEPTTITGSIGVFGLMANTQKFFNNKLGITFDRVYSNNDRYADLGDPNRQMTEFESTKIQNGVNKVYGDFISTVKAGRSKFFADSAAVDKVAQGRVWTGIRAKELGLVDELGGLEVAVKMAAKKANLGDNYEQVNYPEMKSPIEKIFDKSPEEQEEALVGKFLTKEQVYLYQTLKGLNDKNGVYMRSYFDLEIE